MFDNNPFRDVKNYWKSYYSNLTEGWNDEVEDVTGFTIQMVTVITSTTKKLAKRCHRMK